MIRKKSRSRIVNAKLKIPGRLGEEGYVNVNKMMLK